MAIRKPLTKEDFIKAQKMLDKMPAREYKCYTPRIDFELLTGEKAEGEKIMWRGIEWFFID